jgi:hypothetical protein
MNRKTILFIAASSFAAVLSIVACSSDSGTGAGPANKPPTTMDPTGGDSGGPGPDGGPGMDGSSSGAVCNGPTFDNTRIPGWPTVPQP